MKRWTALTRYLHDGAVPVDNNHLENHIRPVALGRGIGCSPAVTAPASGRPR